MAPDAEDCEGARLHERCGAAVHGGGARVGPALGRPARAWAECEGHSPGEGRRLLPASPAPPHKPRLQAGLTLGVHSTYPQKPLASSIAYKTKFQKRKEKLVEVLRPPYFILSMILLIICLHVWGRASWAAALEFSAAQWRAQPWRLLSYGLVHAHARHLALNALVALAVSGVAAGARAGLVARGGGVGGRAGGGRAGRGRAAAAQPARGGCLRRRVRAAHRAPAQPLPQIRPHSSVVVPAAQCPSAGPVGRVLGAGARRGRVRGPGGRGPTTRRARGLGGARAGRRRGSAASLPRLYRRKRKEIARVGVSRAVGGAAGGGRGAGRAARRAGGRGVRERGTRSAEPTPLHYEIYKTFAITIFCIYINSRKETCSSNKVQLTSPSDIQVFARVYSL